MRLLQLALTAIALGSVIASAQESAAGAALATPKPPRALSNPSPVKAQTPTSRLQTFRGELALVMSAAPFGPSTKIKDGELVMEARPMPLSIEHDGKSYSIYITRKTKLDDDVRFGMFTSGATYRVVGTLRESTIIATEIAKE